MVENSVGERAALQRVDHLNRVSIVKVDDLKGVAHKGDSVSCESLGPPDGGARAWTVMLSAFICNGIIFGVINTYGVIYLKLQESLKAAGDEEASSKAALVGSLTIGTTFFLSPISGILTDMIGLQKTTFIGGCLTTAGMFLSSYVIENTTLLYLTYGITFGTGAALAYTPTLAILGHYFKRYLGKVNGFVTAGSSAFTAVLPIILKVLITNTGLDGTLKIESLICSFIILCSLLYKPRTKPTTMSRARCEDGAPETNVCTSLINVNNWKKKKYIIWAFSIPIALFGYFVPYVHMGKFVKDTFPGRDENLPVMFIGITSGLGRLLFGFIADLPRVNRILLQQISFVVIGTMTMILPITQSFTYLLVIVSILGLFDGCFISLLGPIAYDICGPAGATQAIGFLLGLCSLPLTVGPPIAGILYDHSGSYTIPFIIAGIPPIIGAITMLLVRFVKDDESNATPADHALQPLATQVAWSEDITENGKHENNNPRQWINRLSATLASTESLNDKEESEQ